MSRPEIPNHESPSDGVPTPVERAFGAGLRTLPGADCLEATVLIELAEKGRASRHWSSGMGHIVRCPSCREQYRETLALRNAPVSAGAVAPPDRSRRRQTTPWEGWRRKLLPYIVAAATASLFVWLLLLALPLREEVRRETQNRQRAEREREAIQVRLRHAEAALSETRRLQGKESREQAQRTAENEKLRAEADRIRKRLADQRGEIARLRRSLQSDAKTLRVPSVAPRPGTKASSPDPVRIAALTLPDLRYLASDTADAARGGSSDATPSAAAFPLSLLAPVATRVRPERVVFQWTPMASRGRYYITLTDADTGATVLEGETTEALWRTPRPLPPGKTLRWKVVFRETGEADRSAEPPAPIRSQAAYIETISLRQAAAVARSMETGKDRVLANVLVLLREGLFQEAHTLLEYYRLQNPDDSVAQTMAQRLQTGWVR